MAQNYRNPPGRSEEWRGGRFEGSDRDRQRGGEQRFESNWEDRGRYERQFGIDQSPSQGGYSEEFGQRRSRNRDDYNDRELGSRYYGSRGSSGANYQAGRSYGGEYDREGESRYDQGRFDEGNRFESADQRDYGERDLGGAEFTLGRGRRTSTSHWREDPGSGGGYFGTGSYVDDGGASRGFGRDFERARARAQQESDVGSFRDQNRETSGDYRNYGRSSYGAQSNYGRGEDAPWRSQQYGGYEDRSSWNYGGGQQAGSGSSGGAFGRDYGSSDYSRSGGSRSTQSTQSTQSLYGGVQSYRGRGPQGYQRSDDRLKEMICERLTDDPAIDASNVTVDVTGQIVKLSGTVDDRSTKYEIEELVENFGGVKDIDNQLRVQSSRSSSSASTNTQSGQQARGGSDWEAGSSSTAASSNRNESRGTSSGASTGTPSAGSTGRKN